MGIIVVN